MLLQRLAALGDQRSQACVPADRGVVAPGYLADLNVFDHESINARAPELVQDLPAGGTRLLQKSSGYAATLKRGQVTAEEQ